MNSRPDPQDSTGNSTATLEDSVTHWLSLWGQGDEHAIDRVTDLVYQDLRRLAAYHLQGESESNTLQPTALVHEAYLRVSRLRKMDWRGRRHFISVVTHTMRRILVDHARARDSLKRGGGGAVRVNLDETAIVSPQPDRSVVALDEALTAFAEVAPRQARVVELRYFGGLQEEEIVEVLKISPRTVRRDWDFARAWLVRELS
jgi:RNA polymerase sigma factor (TIGR02999 family)